MLTKAEVNNEKLDSRLLRYLVPNKYALVKEKKEKIKEESDDSLKQSQIAREVNDVNIVLPKVHTVFDENYLQKFMREKETVASELEPFSL